MSDSSPSQIDNSNDLNCENSDMPGVNNNLTENSEMEFISINDPSLNNNNPGPSNKNDSKTAEFVVVSKKKKTPKKKREMKIIGTDTSTDLSAIPKIKWLHLSRFANTTTPDDIVKFISSKTNIPTDSFKCFMLVKKDANVSELKFVTFKLSVSHEHLSTVMDSSLWPIHVQVKYFLTLDRKEKTQTIQPEPPSLLHQP